jgi:hypothetical protein
VRTVDCRGIAPAQAIALDVDNAAQHAPVVHPRFATRTREIRRKPLHLLVGQPKLLTHGGFLRLTQNQTRSSRVNS